MSLLWDSSHWNYTQLSVLITVESIILRLFTVWWYMYMCWWHINSMLYVWPILAFFIGGHFEFVTSPHAASAKAYNIVSVNRKSRKGNKLIFWEVSSSIWVGIPVKYDFCWKRKTKNLHCFSPSKPFIGTCYITTLLTVQELTALCSIGRVHLSILIYYCKGNF